MDSNARPTKLEDETLATFLGKPQPVRDDLEKNIVMPQQEIDDLEWTWGMGDLDRAFQNLELERRRLEAELKEANERAEKAQAECTRLGGDPNHTLDSQIFEWKDRALAAEAARAQERERCAKVCEAMTYTQAFHFDPDNSWCNGAMAATRNCVEAIRALPQMDTGTAAETGVRDKYQELLFAVSHKHPGETRHETALRYIMQAENRMNPPQCDTGTQAKSEGLECEYDNDPK